MVVRTDTVIALSAQDQMLKQSRLRSNIKAKDIVRDDNFPPAKGMLSKNARRVISDRFVYLLSLRSSMVHRDAG